MTRPTNTGAKLRRAEESLRGLAASMIGPETLAEIELLAENAKAATLAILIDDGRIDAAAILLASVNSPSAAALLEAMLQVVVARGRLPQRQRDQVAAVLAAGWTLGPERRRQLAACFAELVDLEADAIVVLQSLAVPFAGDAAWRRAHAAALEEPGRGRCLAQLAALGLVVDDQATEVGRALVRAMAKVGR